MGMVNVVVPLEQLEDTTVEWCKIMLQRSPMALRMIKRGLNSELDGPDRKITRLNSSHETPSRMPSSACKKKQIGRASVGKMHSIVYSALMLEAVCGYSLTTKRLSF